MPSPLIGRSCSRAAALRRRPDLAVRPPGRHVSADDLDHWPAGAGRLRPSATFRARAAARRSSAARWGPAGARIHHEDVAESRGAGSGPRSPAHGEGCGLAGRRFSSGLARPRRSAAAVGGPKTSLPSRQLSWVSRRRPFRFASLRDGQTPSESSGAMGGRSNRDRRARGESGLTSEASIRIVLSHNRGEVAERRCSWRSSINAAPISRYRWKTAHPGLRHQALAAASLSEPRCTYGRPSAARTSE